MQEKEQERGKRTEGTNGVEEQSTVNPGGGQRRDQGG